MKINRIQIYMFYSLLLSCCFFLSCGGGNDAGTIDGGKDVVMTISPDSLNIDFNEHTATLAVKSNKEWSVYSTEDWCKCSQSGSVEETTNLVATIGKNTGMTDRTAKLVFNSGKYTKEVEIKQTYEKVDTTGIVAPEGYALVWHDEFNNPRLSGGKPALPNSDDWSYETGNGGWGNNELENYIPGLLNTDTCAVVSDGSLKIIAKKVASQVLSVRMNTQKSWTYGYFEARLKLPKGKGTWPAFWMMPKNYTSWPADGEIDIMEEVGYNPNYVSSTIHCTAYNHTIGTQKTAQTDVSTSQSEYHLYALEWTADYIKAYVDGQCYFTFTNDKTNNKNTWPFNAPFYLKLNLAWGGDWGGAQGVDESILPATYEIDYVRVFQKK